jgi:hypothetical protein
MTNDYFDFQELKIRQIAEKVEELINSGKYSGRTLKDLQYGVLFLFGAFNHASAIAEIVSGELPEEKYRDKLYKSMLALDKTYGKWLKEEQDIG